jgi:hypothetical protein
VQLVPRGELTFARFGITVIFLWRIWRDRGSSAFTLTELMEEVRWPWSYEKLRIDVHALGKDGALFKVVSPGRGAGHKTWTVTVGEAWEFDSKGVPRRLPAERGTAGAIPEFKKPSTTADVVADTETEEDEHSAVRDQISRSLAVGRPSPTYDPLEMLVAGLRDADDQTLASFRTEFGQPPEVDVAGTSESLRARRARKGKPLLSEAGYARQTLRARRRDRLASEALNDHPQGRVAHPLNARSVEATGYGPLETLPSSREERNKH